MQTHHSNWWVGLAMVLWGSSIVPSQGWILQSSAQDSAGGWVSNAGVVATSCAGQMQPVGIATNPQYVSYGGFMYSFVLDANSDHDGDTLCDEVDTDDDNDGILDGSELQGMAFEPATPTDPFLSDTDSDGASDMDEARARTNPQDSEGCFAMLHFAVSNGFARMSWKGREGTVYHVLSRTNPCAESAPSSVSTVTAVNGTGLWQETETETTLPIDGSGPAYYHVGIEGE